jgi:hypothetical protein
MTARYTIEGGPRARRDWTCSRGGTAEIGPALPSLLEATGIEESPLASRSPYGSAATSRA